MYFLYIGSGSFKIEFDTTADNEGLPIIITQGENKILLSVDTFLDLCAGTQSLKVAIEREIERAVL